MLTGTGITVIVQSSSTTTSLMIPLAASRVWELETIYPFTLGANLGTCATAFLAATAVTGSTSIAALQIALAHLLHNTLSILTIYGIPALRSLPLRGARWLARSANNPWAIASYILGIFFLIPGLAIAASLL
jgi:sodium-dependent phosphate cotransporter